MKRPWLMAAWPLLLLFYSSATLTTVVDSNKSKNNDARLKVSIRKDTMLGVPSCQHTFSQIELLNMHSSEPIMIYSIQTIPEETVLVRPGSSPSQSPSTPTEREPKYGRSWSGGEIPQQLHVSKLPSKSLSLGPGQVAIVPVTFLPRYPSFNDCDCSENEGDYDQTNNSLDDNDYSTTTSDGRSPSPLSSTARLDLVDLVGERVLKVIDNKRQHLRHTLDPTYRRRNNMNPDSLPKGDEQYDVTTTVIVDTSRGVVKLPIAASSIRENSFHIPDVIQFHHPSFTNNNEDCDADTEGEEEFDNYDAFCDSTKRTCATSTTTETKKGMARNKNRGNGLTSMDGIVLLDTLRTIDQQEDTQEKNDRASALDTIKSERECFDLYLSNPFLDRELQIMEALVSRPEFVSVQFDPGRMAAPDLTMLVGSGPSQVVRQWTLDGPLYLPPESDNHYILSICTAFEGEIERDEGSETYLDEMSKWIDSGDPTRNLGFLQIRTDAETLFIGLEHAENVPLLSLQNESVMGSGSRQISDSSDSSSSLPTSMGNDRIGPTSTLLRPLQDRLDYEMISTTSPAMHATFGLQNKSPVPIRIMRVSVGIDSAGDKENERDVELVGLNLKVGAKSYGRNDIDDGHGDAFSRELGSLILGATASLDNIFEMTCSLHPDRFVSDSNKESFSFNGTVIIRGTMDTELSYNQWREEILRDPYRDEHLTVELPFTISILNGRVEALIERSSHPYPQLFAAQSWQGSGRAVSHLFFPMNQYVAVEESEDGLPQQMYLGANEIRHDLRILSNMVLPLKLVGAKIIDDNPSETDSLCDRFNVSTTSPANSDYLYYGFEDIGLLSVKYKFDAKGKRGDKNQEFFPENVDPHLPKKCSMVVMTRPDEVGTFQIPLLIFPGRPEVTSADSALVESSKENRALLGFGHLLSWCRTSPLGRSFVKTLQKLSEDRRKPKSDIHLLSKFMLDNSGWDTKSKPKFLPILLKMGAVDSGKISKMHVYLTNHNPIPLSVSIDVGEVEGMSITLSRDESQTTGDGNSLLDHFPNHGTDSLVQFGKNKDHPVAGLLDFLTSNEQALEFLSKFNFRDSLSLHEPAIKDSDVLQVLHDWHSKATFYRDPVSNQSNRGHSSQCENDQRPPVYSSFNISQEATDAEGLLGPLIYSSDKRFPRPLTECWRRDPAEMSTDRNIIKIPPGARARFEVQVRAPPQSYLKDDISHLVMSGLILSTNLGDVMPIFVVTEALQGQLQASSAEPTKSQERNEETEILSVPLELSWDKHRHLGQQTDADAINTSPLNGTAPISSHLNSSYLAGNQISGNGVPLYLRSSFSRNVSLLNVESCNPWFSFVPLESSNAARPLGDRSLVGFVRTNVDCSLDHSSERGFPSFYQCVLNWFSNRLKLQPEGCGIKDSNLNFRQIDNVKRTIEVGLRRLKKSYKSSIFSGASTIDLTALAWDQYDLSHIKTGRRKNDGLISDLASYDAILKALKIANDLGYNLLSSSLKATVEYDSQNAKSRKRDSFGASSKQNLSLTIRDLEIESLLEIPKLFDGEDDHLEFKPTIVGSVVSSLLSVRNPTGVPVRIRLGIAPSSSNNHFDDVNQVESVQSPYIQNGKSSVPTNESTAYSWWDGNGGFFVPNEQGDVIRSHSNISVTGGGGTTSISLVNPSLNSQVGFLVGCGKRCGLRDKSNPNHFLGNPISTSPIGASSASGTTLKGSVRHDSPDPNDQTTTEPVILAGDTSVSTPDGPSAFAIPFSALDEIVIPPFGKGKLGPIYFRPPGRHKAIGCDVAKQSGARLRGEKDKLCESQIFDSVIYLENSLTGIEKVGLVGKSVWNHLYFIDPPPKEGHDAFGDIEFRDGMPTLLFSGTSKTDIDSGTKHSIFGKSAQHLSVVKEIVLFNGGDAVSEISAVSLFGTSLDKKRKGSCSFGSFRLLNCWESSLSGEGHADANIQSSFTLGPGESRSLYVEHIPDCRAKKEFVTLNVHLTDDGSSKTFKPGRSRARGTDNPFRKPETSMVVGYQMDAFAHALCTPSDTRVISSAIHIDLESINDGNYSSRVEVKPFDNGQEESPVLIFQIFLFSSAALVLCHALHARFHAILAILQKSQGEPTKNVRNWNAAFRCLARAQPTSTELQTLSREQMRQDVIGRYKAKGNTPSSSLNSTNGFSRDRRAALAKTSRHRTGREGSSGNERTRPFSDALFHDTSIADDSSLRLHFPIGLGWRTAYSRGIIKDNSLHSTSFHSKAKALIDGRAERALEKDNMKWIEENDSETENADESFSMEGKQNNSYSFENVDTTNGTTQAAVERRATTIMSLTLAPNDETKSIETKTPRTNGEPWKKTSRSNPGRGTIPVAADAQSAASLERKERSSRQTGRQEKPTSHAQLIKSNNASEASRRTQKSIINSKKTIESDASKKQERVSKHAQSTSKQKEKASKKSTVPASLPKVNPPKAWQGERQKPDARSVTKKEITRNEKKSKTKDKTKKKTTTQTVHEKKSVENSARENETDSILSKDIGINTNQVQSQPIVSPPPGFGAPDTKIHLHPVSTTDSQLPLDTMLHPTLAGVPNEADLSLVAPSYASSAQLPFQQTDIRESDLLFSGAIHESNLTPTTRGFNVVDVATKTSMENSNTLPSPVEQPWLPPLLAEEPEPVEQPWLPALRNEEAESGFDVMDFLDGILQDGSSAQSEPTLEVEAAIHGAPGRIGDGGNTSSTPVFANPWAKESRAAAYGISFDDDEGNTKTASTAGIEDILKGSPMKKVLPSGIGGNLPLLTPAAILNTEGNGNSDVEEDDKVISFYAGLIDE